MINGYSTTGLVATTPRHLVTAEGLNILSFRLLARDGDGPSVWLTVTAFNQLAENAAESISKGDRVTVTGGLTLREWENVDRAGVIAELEATALGHDLNFCTTRAARVAIREAVTA